MRHPNDYQTSYDLFYAVAQDLVSYGVAYIYIDRSSSGNGEPRALWSFSPPELKVRVGGGERWYETDQWATDERLLDKDMIKIEERPGSELMISSALERSWSFIIAFNEAMRRILNIWKHGATASQYISFPGTMTDAAKQGALSYLQSVKGRSGAEAGQPIVLEGGGKVERIELPGSNAMPQYLKDIIRMIAATMGCPSSVASGEVETKYDNFGQTVAMVLNDVIHPVALQIAAKMSSRLGVEVKVDVQELLLGPPRERTDVLMNWRSFMTTNEVRSTATEWGFRELRKLEGDEYDRIPDLEIAREELQIRRDASRLLSRREGLTTREDVEDVVALAKRSAAH